ncbi:MAG: hypothetical protein ACI85F_001576 [Bacteroidia bacterium]|jgi:hypothetical protein
MTTGKIIKIGTRTLLIALVVLIVLLSTAYALLRLPRVQTYLTTKLTVQLSEDLNTRVEVGGVDVGFFNRVILEELYVEDLAADTLAYFEKLHFGFNGFDQDSMQISFGEIRIDGPKFFLKKLHHEDRFNLMFIIDHFKVETDSTSPQWNFDFDELTVHRGSFQLLDKNKDHTRVGIEYMDLDVRHIEFNIDEISIVQDSIYGNVRALSCFETRGFRLDGFKGKAKVSPDMLDVKNVEVQTEHSLVQCDVLFNYTEWRDYLDFINEVRMDVNIVPGSILDLNDLSFFAPKLIGIGDHIIVSGHVYGKVKSLKGRNMDIRFGNATRIQGDVDFDGLPEIEQTFMFLDLKRLETNYADLKTVPIPPFQEDRSLSVPSNIARLGNIRFNGNFTGFLSDFVAYGKLNTRLGSLRSDVLLKQDYNTGTLSYSGTLKTQRLDVGTFLGVDSLGRLSLDASIDGKGLTAESIDAQLEGRIKQVEIMGYDYKNIDLNGRLFEKRFEGDYSINDENLDMGFAGVVDLGGDEPYFNFRATVQKGNLSKLKLLRQREDASIRGDIVFNFVGNDIDELIGNIDMYNITYSEPGHNFNIGNINFSVTEDEDVRHLVLNSGVLDARFDGKFLFKSLRRAANNMVGKHLPRYAQEFEKLGPEEHLDFGFFLELHDADLLIYLLEQDLELANGTRLAGRYASSGDLIEIDGHIPSMSYQGVRLEEIVVQADNPTELFQLDMTCAAIHITDSMILRNLTGTTGSFDNRMDFGLDWNNLTKKETRGRINGRVDFESGGEAKLRFSRSLVSVRDLQWIIDPLGEIAFDSTGIAVSNIKIQNEWQKFAVDGKLGKLESDGLQVSLEKFDVGNFNVLLQKTGLELGGSVTGQAELKALYGNFSFISDLQVDSLILNNHLIGSGAISNKWLPESKGIEMNALLKHDGIDGLSINGTYFPQSEQDNYDLDVAFVGIPVSAFEHYVDAMVTELTGTASAEITISGPTETPELQGYVSLDTTGLRVDYLNTQFQVNDTVLVRPDGFYMEQADARDINGKKGSITGFIKHENFKNWTFDASVNADNFLALNTNGAMNSLYYGKAYASGLVRFSGEPTDMFLDMKLKTERGTRFHIPLDGTETVAESDFITFKKHGEEENDNSLSEKYQLDLSNLTMNFDLEVTTDAQVQLIFDQKTGDIMKGRGSGDLKMKLDNLSGFRMFGDFVIADGEYLFTLQNVINKKFNVSQGGSLSWSGDPYNAEIDITALYSVRTSLYDLMYPDTSDVYRRRVLVDCTMKMKDKLLSPKIEFGVDLPNSDERINTEVQNKIGIGNVQEMNRQVFGLLVLNKFFPVSNGGLGQETGGFLSANSAELLSNQLSNWLSQISNDVDVGVNYRPGTAITNDAVEVALSTQILNDRVIIDGNVGVAGNNNTGEDQPNNASNIVGDVNVEYKITPDGRFRIKAFNKSNDINSLAENNAPFTQGVGISYRKEFETLGDLFKFLKRKEKEVEEELTP